MDITLTTNELQIMEVLWSADKPLLRSEIIELSPNRTWSKSSIHILLNKMLEKGAIKVEGFARTNKNYGRTYAPVITRDEYVLSAFKQINKISYNESKTRSVTAVFSALIQDSDVDDELLNQLEQMIEERRGQKGK